MLSEQVADRLPSRLTSGTVPFNLTSSLSAQSPSEVRSSLKVWSLALRSRADRLSMAMYRVLGAGVSVSVLAALVSLNVGFAKATIGCAAALRCNLSYRSHWRFGF